MATERPLAIEAPRQDSSLPVSGNEHAVVPVATPGPVVPSNRTNDTISQQPTTFFSTEAGKQKIPPGCERPTTSPTANNPPPPYASGTVLAAGEQKSQQAHIETEREITKVGNTAVQDKKTTRYTEKVQHQQSLCMQDGQGNLRVVTRTITEERTVTVTEISQVLCNEIYGVNYSNVRAIKGTARQEDHEAKATCGEKTIDLCCQSLVCHFKNPFKKDATAVEKNQMMNATKRHGRAKGWTILKGLLFPFVSDIVRDFWVTFQLFFALILLSLSASTFTLAGENYQVFHAIHLGFSVLAAFLAVLDSIVSYTQCSACKACILWCKKKAGREKSVEISPQDDTPPGDKQDIEETANAGDTDIEKEAATAKDNESRSRKRCRKCFEGSRTGLDISRLLLTEFILVPIIFCDMFEVATGKGFSSDVTYHRLGFALMVYDSIGLIVFVFLVRLVIVGGMIRAEQKMHPTQEEVTLVQKAYEEQGIKNAGLRDYGVDPSIKRNSLMILITFFLHVFGQTLAHALMLVAVGAKVAYDTRNFGSITLVRQSSGFPFTTRVELNTDINATSYLWYMMVATYILPTLGIGTFFIVNNYWVQQFLIGLCIDFVKLLQIFEDTNLIPWQDEKPSVAIGKFVRMNEPQGMKSLPTEYEEMRKINFCEKFVYPFKSPGLVIFCMLYAAGQFAFVLCSVYAIDDMSRVTLVFLNGGGWLIYVFVAAVMGAIINIYAFLVAGLWVMIIALVIAAICISY